MRQPRFLGPIFIVIGLGVVVGLLQIEADSPAPAIFGCVVGGIFALAGLALALYRNELWVHFATHKYERQKGWVFALKEHSGELSDFDRVVLDSVVRRTKDSTFIAYTCDILLRHADDKEDIRLAETSDELKARSRGEALAKAFSVPLLDKTGEKPLERTPEELDLSLRERARKRGEAFDFKELANPPGKLSECLTVEGRVLTLLLPRGGPAKVGGCFLLLFAGAWNSFVVVALLALPGQMDESGDTLIALAVLVAFLLVGIGLLFAAAWVLLGRRKVTVSPEAIIAETICFGRSWRRREMRSDEVEEAGARTERRPGETPQVYVRTDRAIIKFGAGLKSEELEWLGRLVRGVLSA